MASVKSGTRSISVVIQQIDNLVAKLQSEETTDLTNKEICETQRAEKTRQAKTESVAIDEATEEIVRARAKVDELNGQMAEQRETITKLTGTLQDLERQREDENTQYLADKADDQKAVQLIAQAITVLQRLSQELALAAVKQKAHVSLAEDFKTATRATSLVEVKVHQDMSMDTRVAHVAATAQQKSSHRRSSNSHQQPVEVAAGEAPPPPPATWENPTYTGKTNEHTGILAILGLLEDDINKDIASADAAEQEAVSAYDTQKSDLDLAVQAAKDAVSDYEVEKAGQDQTIVDTGVDRTSKRAELKSTMDEIKALEPGCDFLLVNYNLRRTNRQVELDGLSNAKAILQGANFA